MTKLVIPLLVCALGVANIAQAQSFEEYIDEVRGDTVVVKTSQDMEDVNTLIDAIELDSEADDNRVYELKRGGLYLQDRQTTLPSSRNITIIGQGDTPMVQGTEDDGRPALIAGTLDAEGTPTNSDLLQFGSDLTIKNTALSPASGDNSQGWTFLTASNADNTVILDNVLMEHTNWIFIQSNNAPGTRLHIKDSYFVNMSGHSCRRNGGVYDNVGNPTHTIEVENSTHVMAAGMMYKMRGHKIDRAFFNQNTFVNSTGQIFTTMGYQTNWTVTNNLFVNSNIQAYAPGLDSDETDQDDLPHGIINVNHLPASFSEADDERFILVDRNGVFWDERLDEIVSHLNDNNVACEETSCNETNPKWVTQMILMNDRTAGIFDDNDRYPNIHQSNWITDAGDPGFANMPDMLDEVISWSIAAAPGEVDGTDVLAKLRSDGNETELGGEDNNFTSFDWPVAVNLNYSNSAYISAGLAGLPLGDLNWFPSQKADFENRRDDLHAELESALSEGRSPEFETIVSVENEDRLSVPERFSLAQNYPNPFNPTTQIQFTLQNPANVTLEVYDVTGRLVRTLVNDAMTAGTHRVSWNATNQMGQTVSSGVYIYQLRAGDFTESRTMTFVK